MLVSYELRIEFYSGNNAERNNDEILSAYLSLLRYASVTANNERSYAIDRLFIEGIFFDENWIQIYLSLQLSKNLSFSILFVHVDINIIP